MEWGRKVEWGREVVWKDRGGVGGQGWSDRTARGHVLHTTYLGEDKTRHDALDEHAKHRLGHDGHDGRWTRMSDGPRAVADRMLRLDGEEQRTRKVVDTDDAGRPRVIGHVVGVAVDDADGEPEAGEKKPTGDERQREQEHVVPPLGTRRGE